MKPEDRLTRYDWIAGAAAGFCVGLPFGGGFYLGWAFMRWLIRCQGA